MLATLASQRTETLTAEGEPLASALTSGFHLAYLVGAGVLAAAFVIALVVLEPVKAPAHGEAPEAGDEDAAEPEPAYAES